MKILTDAAARHKHDAFSGFIRYARRTESDAAIGKLDGAAYPATGDRPAFASKAEEKAWIGQRLQAGERLYVLRASYASDHRTRQKERTGVWTNTYRGSAGGHLQGPRQHQPQHQYHHGQYSMYAAGAQDADVGFGLYHQQQPPVYGGHFHHHHHHPGDPSYQSQGAEAQEQQQHQHPYHHHSGPHAHYQHQYQQQHHGHRGPRYDTGHLQPQQHPSNSSIIGGPPPPRVIRDGHLGRSAGGGDGEAFAAPYPDGAGFSPYAAASMDGYAAYTYGGTGVGMGVDFEAALGFGAEDGNIYASRPSFPAFLQPAQQQHLHQQQLYYQQQQQHQPPPSSFPPFHPSHMPYYYPDAATVDGDTAGASSLSGHGHQQHHSDYFYPHAHQHHRHHHPRQPQPPQPYASHQPLAPPHLYGVGRTHSGSSSSSSARAAAGSGSGGATPSSAAAPPPSAADAAASAGFAPPALTPSDAAAAQASDAPVPSVAASLTATAAAASAPAAHARGPQQQHQSSTASSASASSSLSPHRRAAPAPDFMPDLSPIGFRTQQRQQQHQNRAQSSHASVADMATPADAEDKFSGATDVGGAGTNDDGSISLNTSGADGVDPLQFASWRANLAALTAIEHEHSYTDGDEHDIDDGGFDKAFDTRQGGQLQEDDDPERLILTGRSIATSGSMRTHHGQPSGTHSAIESSDVATGPGGSNVSTGAGVGAQSQVQAGAGAVSNEKHLQLPRGHITGSLGAQPPVANGSARGGGSRVLALTSAAVAAARR